MPLVTREAVELARTGTWNTSTGPWTCTRAQIADIVRAAPRFDDPIIKPGHVDPRYDGEPALGRIFNVRATDDGERVIGDVEIPDWLDEEMHVAYPNRSVELDLGVETADGERYAAVMTGVALLGVTPPAVKGLAKLRERFTRSREAGYVAAAGIAASIGAPERSDTEPQSSPVSGESPSGDARKGSPGVLLPRGWDARAPQVSRIGEHRVDVTPKMREALGLDESADEQAVEAAPVALRTKAEQPAPIPPVVETGQAVTAAPAAQQAAVDTAVEQRIAASEARIAAKLAASEQRIAGTEAANAALREELGRATSELAARKETEAITRRETVLASAIKDGKITPADRSRYEVLYEKAPEDTVALLDSIARGRAVPVMASGYAGSAETGTDDDALYNSWFPKAGD